MNITTKFNLNDTVFFINEFKIAEAKIFSISIDEIEIDEIEIDKYTVEYTIINKHNTHYRKNSKYFKEEWLFGSKEELIKSL